MICFVAFDKTRDEFIGDRFLNENTRRAGADLALIEGKQRRSFEAFVKEIVVGIHHAFKEDIRRFAAKLKRDRDQILRSVLHDQASGRRLAGKRDLGDPRAGRERFAGLDAEAVDDIDDAFWQQIADQLHQDHDGRRCLLGRFDNDAVAGGKCRCDLPRSHQHREIPRNDLADDAERFADNDRKRVLIKLDALTFFGTDDARKIAKMIDRQRHIGGHRLADRLAVVPRLGTGEQFEILLHAVGDLEQDIASLGRRGFAPGFKRRVGRVEGRLDVGLVRPGDLCKRPAVDRRNTVKILAALRCDPFAADVVFVLFFEFWDVVRLFCCVHNASCQNNKSLNPSSRVRYIS